MPLVLMARSLGVSTKAGLPFNQIFITPELALPEYRQVGPNIDTLMGHAWLDLGGEPQIIGVPDSGERYYSIQLQDMYMNSFADIGRRTTGAKAGAFAITPPGFEGALPVGVTEIKAPTTKVLAYIRTMLRDQEDLEDALAVHTAYTLGPLSAFPDGRGKPIARADRAKLFPHVDFFKAADGFFDGFISGLASTRRLPGMRRTSPASRRLVLERQGRSSETARPTPNSPRRSPPPTRTSGNRSSLPGSTAGPRRDNVPAFIHDPLQRAANNIFGKGTHRSDEAVYWATYQGGVWETGSTARSAIASASPPARRRRSTPSGPYLYGSDYVLFDNPLNRYGILDRTKGSGLTTPMARWRFRSRPIRPPRAFRTGCLRRAAGSNCTCGLTSRAKPLQTATTPCPPWKSSKNSGPSPHSAIVAPQPCLGNTSAPDDLYAKMRCARPPRSRRVTTTMGRTAIWSRWSRCSIRSNMRRTSTRPAGPRSGDGSSPRWPIG